MTYGTREAEAYYDRLLNFIGIDGDEWLLRQLHQTPFTWVVPNDVNRADDGIELRNSLGYDGEEDCSVLEMLAALAKRMEFHWDDMSVFQWFYDMLGNLGLDDYIVTSVRSVDHVDDILQDWMMHNYEPNGAGGLFPLRNPPRDQRRASIFEQKSAYLQEFMEDQGFFDE